MGEKFFSRYNGRMKRIFLTAFFAMMFSCYAQASGDAAPAEGGHGEAKKEEVKAAPPEWMSLQAEIQKLAAEIKGKQDNLIKMFGTGHDAHGAQASGGGGHGGAEAHSGNGFQEINKEHKALRDLIVEYEKKRTILRYRYPEAGAQSDRKYKRIELKSLDQFRSETLVERRLRETSEKIKKVYGYQENQTEKKSVKNKGQKGHRDRQPASDTVKNSEEEKIPLLDEQIILKK